MVILFCHLAYIARPLLMKCPPSNSKYDPAVMEEELLKVNPEYSLVRLPDGRETTVSNCLPAPIGDSVPNLPIYPEPAVLEPQKKNLSTKNPEISPIFYSFLLIKKFLIPNLKKPFKLLPSKI
ncbi:hypothetical protein GE061_006016 [Apolygus lucorum]|uniref:Uncharacterized protein n=1 Tax=Apolygus lucorum TaxID=248454 RepID=A0A8S9WUF7_APOLU|nr:hypothetical protein GE061_006016 [Apolygus lucorum]